MNHVLFLFIRTDFWVGVVTATIVNIGHRAPPPLPFYFSHVFSSAVTSSLQKWQAPLTEKTVTMKRYHRFNNVCTKGKYLLFIQYERGLVKPTGGRLPGSRFLHRQITANRLATKLSYNRRNCPLPFQDDVICHIF